MAEREMAYETADEVVLETFEHKFIRAIRASHLDRRAAVVLRQQLSIEILREIRALIPGTAETAGMPLRDRRAVADDVRLRTIRESLKAAEDPSLAKKDRRLFLLGAVMLAVGDLWLLQELRADIDDALEHAGASYLENDRRTHEVLVNVVLSVAHYEGVTEKEASLLRDAWARISATPQTRKLARDLLQGGTWTATKSGSRSESNGSGQDADRALLTALRNSSTALPRITTAELARFLDVSERGLRDVRSDTPSFPKPLRDGNRDVYDVGAVIAWATANGRTYDLARLPREILTRMHALREDAEITDRERRLVEDPGNRGAFQRRRGDAD
jgi:hypothetical protein